MDHQRAFEWALLQSRLKSLPSGFSERTEKSIEPQHVSEQAAQLNLEGGQHLEAYKNSKNHQDLETSLGCFLQARAIDEKENDDIGEAHSLFNYASACGSAGIARQGLPMIEKALSIYERHDLKDMVFLTVNVLYGALVDELDAQHKTSSKDDSAIARLHEQMRYARETSARLFNHQRGEDIEPLAHNVKQGQVGFSAQEPLGTDNVNECVCMIVHDPKTKKTALAHVDYNITEKSLDDIIDRMPEGPLQARIVGGRFRFRHEGRDGQSQSNIEKVTKLLDKRNIQILSAHVLDYTQPTSITVYPETFEIREASAGLPHPDKNLSNGKLMLALEADQPMREMRVAFDMTTSDRYAPQLLSHEDVKNLRKHFLFLREEQIFKKTQDPAVVDWIMHLNQAYNKALDYLLTTVDETVAAHRKQGRTIDEKDIEMCKRVLFFHELHVGEHANALNEPIAELIRKDFFVQAQDKCTLDMRGLRNVTFNKHPVDSLKPESGQASEGLSRQKNNNDARAAKAVIS